MGLRQRSPLEPEIGGISALEGAFLSISHAQVQQIAAALRRRGSSIVLTGLPGSGKSYLARAAAHLLESQSDSRVHSYIIESMQLLLEELSPGQQAGPADTAQALLTAIQTQMQTLEKELLLVAPRIDHYNAFETAVLEHLIQTQRVRFIGTAQHVIGAADRLVRDPAVRQIAVEPLSIEESNSLLSRILGVERVAPQPLHRWHESTGGNPHALVTLALSATRRGVVQKVRKTAWVATRDEHAPIDFVTRLDSLTPIEVETLELVAYAAPMTEASLFELLDADAVKSLMRQQVLTVRTLNTGITTLITQLPVLTEAVNAHMSPVRRTEIARQCYTALSVDDATMTHASRLRLVRFGMDAGQVLPTAWLSQALRTLSQSGDLHFRLRIALAAMHNEVAEHAAEALISAADFAYFLGDRESLSIALQAIAEFLHDDARTSAISFDLHLKLEVCAVCLDPVYIGRPDRALTEIKRWEHAWQQRNVEGTTHLASVCRMRLLAMNGEVKSALDLGTRALASQDLKTEWAVGPAQALEALLRVQRGEFKEALALAEITRRLMLLHAPSPTLSSDLEGFAIFLAHWARGTTVAARQTIYSITEHARDDIETIHRHSGLIDLAVTLFAVQEARWQDASEVSDRLIKELRTNDPLGVIQFAHSLSALALAALGAEAAAYEALLRSETQVVGISSVLHGFVTMTQLRARHWLRQPDLADRALRLAQWANAHDIPLIELKSLDLIAHATGTLDKAQVRRAEALAQLVDQPVGEAIFTHIGTLIGSGPEAAGPEQRLLSELGIWMPLPSVKELTGREREIALFSALGYTSKFIAERLHLSARTIETHLAHVYTKLGIDGRDGLRRWFAHQREQE